MLFSNRIAFFSGLGVALSVIDDQTSSLVGVAISASLLPPAGKILMLLSHLSTHPLSFASLTISHLSPHSKLRHVVGNGYYQRRELEIFLNRGSL